MVTMTITLLGTDAQRAAFFQAVGAAEVETGCNVELGDVTSIKDIEVSRD